MKKAQAFSVFSKILAIAGGALLLIALLSLGACILALVERLHHGAGLFFADVEIFGFIAFTLAILGWAALFASRELKKHKGSDSS
jgi:hypothetical protein